MYIFCDGNSTAYSYFGYTSRMNKNQIYVALLRGINVGGKNIVIMPRLLDIFERLGFDYVQTQGNSGNVLFLAPEQDQRAMQSRIEKALEAELGFEVMVIVRSKDEIGEILQMKPESWVHPEDKKCNILFLRHGIDKPSVVNGLQPKDGIEELHYHKGVLYWSALLSELTKSNMIHLSKEEIYQEMTARNLSTVQRIWEMMNVA